MVTKGTLSAVAPKIVLKVLYIARVGRMYFLGPLIFQLKKSFAGLQHVTATFID